MIGTARSLIMWDDVVLSGAALGAATVTYILFVWSGYTSMQIIFNTALVGVLGCLFWNVAAQIMNREGPPVPKPSVDFVEAKVDALAAHAKGAAVTAAGLGYRLARGEEANLAAEHEYLWSIKPDCTWVLMTFDDRRHKRDIEIAGLRESIGMLQGAMQEANAGGETMALTQKQASFDDSSFGRVRFPH